MVGPAKYMHGLKLGNEIDNHDIVIRINRGIELVDTNQIDIGSKTDILYSCLIERPENAGKIDVNYWSKCGVKYICAPPQSEMNGISHKTEFGGMVDKNKMKKVSSKIPIRIVDCEFHTELAGHINCRPNTGFLAIYDILKNNPKKLSLYGFSFYLDGFMDGCKSGVNVTQEQYVDKCFNSKRHIQENMWKYAKKTLFNNIQVNLDSVLKSILELNSFSKEEFIR